ncbi:MULTISPECIES: hypothetical protein [unclassified Nocardioides]|uniref:beta strand repeat-containing protein n=1 Tax=unclassified Nocardioides TaxID=2615069 RepID=UPI000056F78C|nr:MULTISPECIES: hypothetical protein [unclassified Nocardioides]ABL80667.1 hypothetical protein Noca_1151 [Nocardioides sp. JS614]
MNSSGIKRGLAVSAVSAMAVAGLPFLASTASATTVASTLGASAVELYAPQNAAAVSTKNDGQNTTVSLLAGGGSSVSSILFQYQSTTSAGTWVDVPGGLVSRDADGVFKFDWSNPPSDLVAVQAVSNLNTTDGEVVALAPNTATTHTVELSSEGALGVFVSPYAAADDFDGTVGNDNVIGQYIGVHGTTSGATTPVTVSQVSHEGQTTTDSVNATSADADGTGAGTTGAFGAIMDIAGYVASSGSDANQLVLNAATTVGAQTNTDDAEGSTLYTQTITTVTATPESQNATAAGGQVTIKVTDQNGKPVANAQVGRFLPDGPDVDTTPDEPGTVLGYTDANGELKVTQTFNGTATYYANTTDADVYNQGTDPADTASVSIYTPRVAQVVIKARGDRTSFDLDEFVDGDEFTIQTLDQNGNAYNEDGNAADGDATEVEYRWIIDPTAAGAPTLTQDWQTDATDGGSTFTVPALVDGDLAGEFKNPDGTAAAAGDLPAGSYTLEARRPNVGLAGGLVNATPATYSVGESEITFTGGADENATVNGSFTATGKLALTGTNGAGLAGRSVPLELTAGVGGAGDTRFAPQSEQPAGVTVIDSDSATAITGADGSFSVKLTDPAVPANVTPTPENDVLTAGPATEGAADGSSLKGTNGADDTVTPTADATGAQNIHWQKAPEVSSISITMNTLDPYNAASNSDTTTPAPGVPVDLDIVVKGKDGDTDPSNDPALQDFPLNVKVSNGFLSPNAETANDAVLADGHDNEGDLWGFFKNDGTSVDTSTGDAKVAGAVVAIEKDSGFDDDGMVTLTVTVTAGGVTETQDITFDDRYMINQGESSLERAAGEPAGDVTVGENLDFNLYTHDQFGNLAGDQQARISDDSTVADFATDEDFDFTLSDFTTSGPGVTAFSDAPTTQTLIASMSPGAVVVGPTSANPVTQNRNVTVSSAPITWVAGPQPKVDPQLVVRGRGGKVDRVKANAISDAAGARATVWVHGKRVGKGVLNSDGNITFRVKDKNGNKKTRYVVKIGATTLTFADQASKRIR